MEILSEHVLKGDYLITLLTLSLIGLIFLSMFVGILISLIRDRGFCFSNVVGSVVCGLASLLIGIGLYTVMHDGARIQYKAIITDFNAVYDQGYEIISNEGKIYTLKKQE